MKSLSKMRMLLIVGVVAGLALFGASAVFYVYWTPYSGYLPVVTYPFRQYAIPTAVVGAIILILVPLLYFVLTRRE